MISKYSISAYPAKYIYIINYKRLKHSNINLLEIVLSYAYTYIIIAIIDQWIIYVGSFALISNALLLHWVLFLTFAMSSNHISMCTSCWESFLEILKMETKNQDELLYRVIPYIQSYIFLHTPKTLEINLTMPTLLYLRKLVFNFINLAGRNYL